MQITDSFSNRPPLPPGGGTPDLETQIKRHQAYYHRLFLRQRLAFWWPRLLLIAVACLIGVFGGQILAAFPLTIVIAVCAGLLLLPAFIAILRHPQFSLLVFSLGKTALAPKNRDGEIGGCLSLRGIHWRSLLHCAGAGGFFGTQSFLATSAGLLAPTVSYLSGYYFQPRRPGLLDAWSTAQDQ